MFQKFFQRGFLVIGFLIFLASPAYSAATAAENFRLSEMLKALLMRIEYTTRLGVEFDDNIFLTEDNEDQDTIKTFTQGLRYHKIKDNHYFEWEYIGNYRYHMQESIGTLSHSASALYSYRPLDRFSVAIGNRFNWLSETRVTKTVGDRLLSLGYVQNAPSIQIKYEVTPAVTALAEVTTEWIDVVNKDNDDFIDNQQLTGVARLEWALTQEKDWLAQLGYQHRRTNFTQIFEKDATNQRPFVGITKKFPGVLNVTYSAGFANIDFDDNNPDDTNIDHQISLETVFSVYTRMAMSYTHDQKFPSLRSEYAQYAADIGTFQLIHTLNPKTTFILGYAYEKHNFNSSDALIGQPQTDRRTFIHSGTLEINRKLNEWLTLNLGYNYSKRDTDFALEGYTANKFTVGLTAEY